MAMYYFEADINIISKTNTPTLARHQQNRKLRLANDDSKVVILYI
jgi:hypothetical protein